MKRIKVKLGSRSYEIYIGSEILAQTGPWLKELGFAGKVVVITNPLVEKFHGEALTQSLIQAGFTTTILQIPDGEEQKSLETAGKLYLELGKCLAERTTPILAFGGGVIGDLAGFVAATYKRGVPLVQIPTTLLAQVDSSIGGKVAVDHGQLKNEIGTFYQPRLVISDVSTLKTLEPKVLSSGLAEVIKYGVIRDKRFFGYLEDNIDRIKSRDEAVLEEIIFRSAKIKADVVAEDEADLGIRAILNYGHTVAHAVESVSNFKITHGEAVAIGMVAAAKIAKALDIFNGNGLSRLENIITQAGLPTRIPDFKVEALTAAMQHDKKVRGGRIRFILPEALGKVLITDKMNLSLIEQVLDQIKQKDGQTGESA